MTMSRTVATLVPITTFAALLAALVTITTFTALLAALGTVATFAALLAALVPIATFTTLFAALGTVATLTALLATFTGTTTPAAVTTTATASAPTVATTASAPAITTTVTTPPAVTATIAFTAFTTTLATLATTLGGSLGGSLRAGHQGLARQLDTVMLVNSDHLDLHQVTHLADFVHIGNKARVKFADMTQAVPAGQDLDEGAKVLDGGDFTLVNAANLHFFGDGFHPTLGSFGPLGVGMGNVDGTVVLDLDLGARAFLDPLDVLAPRPNEQTDLLGIDPGGEQAGSVGGNLVLGFAQGGEHDTKDFSTGNTGLFQGFLDDG